MQELLTDGATIQGYRLSPQQKRLFTLQQVNSKQSYIAQSAILIEGDLDAGLLDSAIQKVIDRNDDLRTAFTRPTGLRFPVQVVADTASLICEKISLVGGDPQRQKEEIDRLFDKGIRNQFDLTQSSLLRCSLIALSEERHILIISLPAVCADARTLDNILNEISLAYASPVKDEESGGGAPQYIQFSEWQNELLDEDDESEGKEFWRRYALPQAASTTLPFGETSRAGARFEPEILATEIAPDLETTLRALAQQHEVTVDVLLLACWQILLWRLTGRSEILMGVMFDGRKFEELNDSLGLFAKWVPLSVQFHNGIQFSQALKQTQQLVTEAQEWQEYFIWGSGREYDGDKFNYPEIGFEYERKSQGRSISGIRFSTCKQYVCIDRSDLKLKCIESSDSLVTEFHYDSSIFEAGDIKRLVSEFQALLASAADDPEAAISKLRILDDRQRQQILFEFNDTETSYPGDHCLHHLFEQQVMLTPDAIAVSLEEEQVSYADLNRRANRLARYLRSLGVGPETMVGICINRSLDMIVGVLGTLKAGGAYVPLDPEYPGERLRFMIEDAQVSILLTRAHISESLPDHAARVVCLDTDGALFADEGRQPSPVEMSPENLAYMIYTSGSTGKPKGAMNAHSGVRNRQLWMQETYPLTSADHVLQLASFSFDFSVWEILGTLSAGARLILVRPGGHKDTAYLKRLMTEEKITVAHFVPSMLQAFLEEPGLEDCDSLNRVFCGGEALSFGLQERFFSRFRAEMHNQYGPTEASIDVTFWDCIRDGSISTVPIGRPNANNSIRILDSEGEPVPIGVSGELLIGGMAVGRGYFGRPDLTAERFVPDPFASGVGARLYRTGDLARYWPDGNIDYQGRIDEQVKIRGFRIELAEIEAVLNSHPHVRETVVIAQQGPAGDKRLVGYVVPVLNQAVSGTELRNYAAEKLPDYMVPALIVEIGQIPLTASGKVDRKTLSNLEPAMERRSQRSGPRNVIEEIVSGIWAEVLGVESVGVDDNFFDIGGHSLLATQTMSRVREAFGVDLELRILFDRPTVGELSKEIERKSGGEDGPQAPAITPAARDGKSPLSFAQQRLWFIDQFESDKAAYLLPVASRLKGELNIAALEHAISEVVARHESVRTIIKVEEGTARQVITAGDQIKLKLTDLRALSESDRQEQVKRITQDEAERAIDLTVGPLVRASLLLIKEEDNILLLTMHHIVGDGWSMDVLVKEITELYSAYRTGMQSPLDELEIQYADYSQWQREWMKEDVLERQMQYWRDHLSNLGVFELRTDRVRPAVQSYAGGTVRIEFDRQVGGKLRELSRREGATLFMVLLAAFKVLLSRYSGQEEIVVGTPIAGRNRKEIEGLIGLFANTLVLRTEVKAGSSYRDVLKSIREVTLGAYAHQDVPFEKLVEELHPERDLSRSPLFQVMFSFQTQMQKAMNLPGLVLSVEPTDTNVTKFDLTMDLKDSGEALSGVLEYNSDLFDHETVVAMVRCFQTLLESIVEEPGQPISRLTLLSQPEKEEILVGWNRTAAHYPEEECLHELFEAQARRTPDEVAVVAGSGMLTYRELDARANKLACYLRHKGVGLDVKVGICVDRSLEMVVGLLGILKAGGAYVPLDPSYPRDRLSLMVEDAKIKVLVTAEGLEARVGGYEGEVVSIDEQWEEISEQGDEKIQSGARAENLAYVIYTSGSTGKPKGIMIQHRSVVNFLCSMSERPGLSNTDILLAVTSISFDIAALEIYLPLIVGARLVIARRETAADGEMLAKELTESAATVMQATPTTWRLLLEADWNNENSIKVLCGGEHLPSKLGWELLERTPFLWNLYGPTETTIWSSAFDLAEKTAVIPIGKPVANTQLYILDSELQPVPLRVAGELYIGGDGLARGYNQSPDLTAEKFIPDPFGGQSASRLYKTGDLARHLHDGNVEFLGRNDHQVKIRGYRIEIGEIETALSKYPDLRAGVVSVFEEPDGDKRLVAYLLPFSQRDLSLSSLREFLKEKLPEYMVPSAFVVMEDFPMTPNGKIDRKALPAPERTKAHFEESFYGPRTPLEKQLLDIWTELLEVERIDINDNFFDLGGHSLLAMQVMHRLRRGFGVDIPVMVLFESPTIAEMASTIARHRAEQGENQPGQTDMPAIIPDPANRFLPFPLNDVQQAYWVGRGGSFELGNVASHSYSEFDFFGLDVQRLNRAVHSVIERHDMLKAIILPDGLQRILKEVPPYQITIHDLRKGKAGDVTSHLQSIREQMSHQVMPTDRWPLFNIQASLLPDGRARIHFGLDFLIADALSIGIIFDEISKFYENPELKLPPIKLSFRDCVLADIAEEGSDSYLRAEQYWLGRLATLPPAPELPLAVAPDAVKDPRFIRRAGRLKPDSWARTKKIGLKFGLTPTGILLGAFAEVLATWSKSPRFTINLTIFNRPPVHPEILDIVADFTSLNLLEVDGARPGSFGLRARAIQEQLWTDLDHRAMSGIRVLRELARIMAGQSTPIMPVVFTSTVGQNNLATAPFSEGQVRLDNNDQVYSITQTPQVWLDHQVAEIDEGLLFNWDAVEELFCPGILDDMWQAYNKLLKSLSDEETWRQKFHHFLPEEQVIQRKRVNATNSPVRQGLLHTEFIEQARRRPEQKAVITSDRILTYGELDRWTSEIGRELRENGARPNSLVAVVMEKGWEQVVAVLSVLKSGAAYLPIDATLPEERLHYLLQHGEVELLLTQPWIEARLHWPEGIKRILVQGEAPESGGEPMQPAQQADDLAYVIFTSGSTGLPKGVMIDHRGALNTIIDINQRLKVGAGDRVLALSSLSFDLSVYDIFGMLAAGGAVVIPEAGTMRDPGRWVEMMKRERVTIWNTVPALMEMLAHYVEGRGGERLDDLRAVMMSGDWIAVSLPDRVKAMSEGVKVISLGGATEASIWSILYEIGEVKSEWGSIPYGKPMVNQRFRVKNEMMQECPTWVSGQLYIGGIGLAKGYWKDEEKTRGSFITDPVTGERLYRTGDMGRYLPDGNIEFQGREDTQVKIGGHRIELGEIEAALEQHEEVRGAVALAVGNDRFQRRLIAYVVLQNELTDVNALLGDFLRGKLPEYMIPVSIASIEAFPLSSNGKVDRQALGGRQLKVSGPVVEKVSAGPRTPLEEKIARIWSEVLGVERISRNDGFFDLGGNSINAIRIITRLREAFGVDVPLRELFLAQTFSELVGLVQQLNEEKAQHQAASLERYAIKPDDKHRFEPFPLNDVQYAYWIGRNQFFELGNVAAHGYAEYDLYNVDIDRLNAALQLLIARHDMLRAVTLPDGRQQILENTPPFQIKVTNLQGQSDEAVKAHFEAVRARLSHQMLPTSQWPLFEICASVLEKGRVRFQVSIDILITDAWSSRVLSRELAAFYNNLDATLPPLNLSFRDYVLAEIAFRDSELYSQSLNYWRERLAEIPPAPLLPMVKSPGQVESPRFVRYEAKLDKDRWQRLKARASQVHLTPSALLLATFAEVLYLWSKNTRFTINLTMFNRLPLHPQVDNIVGDFTSVILVPVDAQRTGTFETRARSLQEQLWEIMEHRFVSGIAVLREIARSKKSAPNALTPVVFTSTLFEEVLSDQSIGEDGLEGQQVYGISQTPQVWLDYQVREQEGILQFTWDVVDELFPEGLFEDMFQAYSQLLISLADSEQTWQEEGRPWLPDHQTKLLLSVNATDAPIPEGLLHNEFELRAREAPDQEAVIAPDRRLTYGELDRWTNEIGRELRENGARPNSLVAVVMEKGWEQVVAVLSVLKSGAAYLPIDATLPEERLHYLLQHGEVELLLTQPWIEARLHWPEGIKRILVQGEAPESGGEPMQPAQQADDLAYVIFTSGSTGLPKGVMIDHRGALNTIVDINQRLKVGAGDRVLALSSLSFDLSVYDIFGMLAAGGAVVIPEAGTMRDPGRWVEMMKRERVTIWNTVPALMEMLAHYVEGRGGERLDDLRAVMMSGDWIAVSLPDRVKAMSEGVKVISLGGATEASIWSILYEIEEVKSEWGSIPYGKPMVNQRFRVKNEMMQECPTWVSGQLYIGGIGLAKGYWKDEEKTRGSFITDPVTGERLYRTGDMGRYLPDGNIEFQGREDTQVKIGGHRIELGEIEAALEQHEEVRGAVALAVGNDRSQRRLASYVLLKDQATTLQSVDEQLSTGQVTLKSVGRLLESFNQLELDQSPIPKYRYPSAGSLYPVQTYILIKPDRVEGAAAGVYYYNPQNHNLVMVGEDSAIDPLAFAPADHATFEQSDFVIFLIAQMDAIIPMYGELSADFCLLEAGYMGRMLLTTAQDGEIRLSTLWAIDFDRIRESFSLAGGHMLLHAFAGGQSSDSAPAPHSFDYETNLPDSSLKSEPFTALQSPWRQMMALAGNGSNHSASPVRLQKDIDRLEFKLQHVGIRRLEAGQAHMQLDKPVVNKALIEDYTYRSSDRTYLHQVIGLEEFNRLLSCLTQARLATQGLLDQFQSFSADFYSIQTYVYIKKERVEGVAEGTYHYDPREGRLELLSADVELDNSVQAVVNRAASEESAFWLLFVADPSVMKPIFGEWARDFCLLEAGYIGQTLMTVAPALQIGLCPIGSMDFDSIRHLFNVDEKRILLHSFIGGMIVPRQQSQQDGQASRSARSYQNEERVSAIVEELRLFLSRKLPDYMVPTAITVLDDFPLNSNGKVDRSALAALKEYQFEDNAAFVPPRIPVEHQLAEIWRNLLGVERIGVGDNFFTLGGDSVQAIQFLARAREAGFEIGAQYFFEHPTIADLAEYAQAIEPRQVETPAVEEMAGSGGTTVADFPDAELSQQELDELITQFESSRDQNTDPHDQ